MCSRYSLTTPIEALRGMFRFHGGVAHPPRYNIAPTQPVAIVRLKPGIEASGTRELALVRWGLIPHWVKDPAAFTTLINARAETLIEKPSFRTALRHRRCVVPADCFYEWTGKPGARIPHLIRPHGRLLAPFALAGLWEHWLGVDGSEMETMAIVTVPANRFMSRIHDRMPAILRPEQVDAWLDVRGTSEKAAAALLAPSAEDVLETFEVSRDLNNARNEHVDVQRPVRTTLS